MREKRALCHLRHMKVRFRLMAERWSKKTSEHYVAGTILERVIWSLRNNQCLTTRAEVRVFVL